MKTKTVALIAGACASVAAADPVSFAFRGVDSGRNARISTHGEDWLHVFSGSVMHDIDGLRSVTYCIDPDQWAQTGTSNFERTTLSAALAHRADGAAKASVLAELADLAGPGIWIEDADRDLASAFQIAIWEIVLDFTASGGGDSLSLSAGAFRAAGSNGGPLSSPVQSHYDALVGGLSFGGEGSGGYQAFTSASHQDFMSQIPTPGTSVLGLAGLPLIASRRRP